MKYEKPRVNKIIFSNEDILAASPHKCPKEPGSNGCDKNGELCDNVIQRDYGSCVWILFGDSCSMKAGTNSTNPSASF